MRFSSAATLLSFALNPFAQAAPAVHGHVHAHTRAPTFGTNYQSGVFYVNWV